MAFTSTLVCPWDQATCALVEKTIVDCDDAYCILQKLKDLGLDVTIMQDDVGKMLQFAKDFKATFMPRQP